MNDVLLMAATAITEQHELAQSCAGQAKERMAVAIQHARAAGHLLLRVKAEVGHGRFIPWLEANVLFNVRTAQRYMSAAVPAPKSDRLSHLSSTPKPGSKRALTIAAINRVQHRQDVLSHAVYLVAELPELDDLRADDLNALAKLRDRLNVILEGAR